MTAKRKKLLAIILSVTAVILVAAILIVTTVIRGDKEPVVLRCNGVDITESIYKMYLYSCAAEFKDMFFDEQTAEDISNMSEEEYIEYLQAKESFWETEIDGRLPEEIVKDKTLEALKTYAYYKIECKKNNIAKTEEEQQGFNSSFEIYFQDVDTEKDFGVTKEQFISYYSEMDTFEAYLNIQASQIQVSEDEINEKFNEYRDEYAKVTVKTVFLEIGKKDDPETVKEKIYGIKEELENGADMDGLIEKYSEYKGNDNGQFVVVKTSLIEKNLGKEFIESVLKAEKGDIEVVKTSTGYCLNQILNVAMTDNASSELEVLVQDEKFLNKVDSILKDNPDYDFEIVDEGIYKSIGIPEILK